MHKKRVFSGVQPTGNLHLGNYLGAIKNFVELQSKFECIYCIVDLHAITNYQDPKELKSNILETVATFIASGLDSEKNIMTIIWHDNVLKMKGGRMYYNLLEFLAEQEDFQICTGNQLADKINNELK